MSYRLYTVGPGGRLQLRRTFDSPDDEAAVEEARGHGEAAELWHGGRLVGRLSKLGVFTGGSESSGSANA